MASTVGSRQEVRSRTAGRRAVDPVLAAQIGFPLALIAI
jgi:hypothetical protein